MPVSESAAAFLGIKNENEFYSAHYLSEVFKGDINQIISDWKEKEENEEAYKTPYNRLKLLARDYFAIRERIGRERHDKKKLELQYECLKQFLNAFDISWDPQNYRVESKKLKEDIEVPVLSIVSNQGSAKLWVLAAVDFSQDGMDPLLLNLKENQFVGDGPHADSLKNKNWYDLINEVIFSQDDPPRWVMLLSDRQCILIDRYKWLQNRLLRFDWDEILGRKDDSTLKATAALLHCESLVPDQGASLLDNLDENSHKHAFGVSEDLKYALREAIELLGNEAVSQLITNKDISFKGKKGLDPEQLSRECLRYMYRLLFLFYIEARPELGYLPQDSEAYRKGYSLESLRDLELVKLNSDESRHGYFFNDSINKLFKLINEGYQGIEDKDLIDLASDHKIHNTFVIESLDSHLFNPKFTPYLSKVKFTNQTLQQIICLMSLTRETSGRGRRRRGRVSYAQLGINQLGAVYEALLSYRGFFASTDLYEVKKASEDYNELETGYFVTAEEIETYKEGEKVYVKDENGHQSLKIHPKGNFIYRMAGRDRQKSASYYTPEVLTKCLVKYTLKERLEGLNADEILGLTVCEPAMGSAAFLNEAVNQLAEAYLTKKQAELNKRIPHEDYRENLQQVKMHIADHNVFGVDLNPIAVELAEVSLWLNALSKSRHVPWFGYQIFAGNSLIGARRQVYRSDQLTARETEKKWYSNEPLRIDPLKPVRDENHIYHFLLPDLGMVGVDNRDAKVLRPDDFLKIKNWKNNFIKPITQDELGLLKQMSESIDQLFEAHTSMLKADRRKTEDRFSVWGQKTDGFQTSTQEKDNIRFEGIFNANAKMASPYRRLKLVMDYWCSLWFWPLDKVDLLPDRSMWLFEVNLILQNEVFYFQATDSEKNDLTQEQKNKVDQVKTARGELNLEKLFDQFPRLKMVNELSEKYRFFHWELTFSDVFSESGGFDIILGNPPWIKVEWNEGGVLGDFNPQFVLRNLSATQLREKRIVEFENNFKVARSWYSEVEEAEGVQNFLNADQNYAELKGQKANLYKCFLPQAWWIGNADNVSGFLHPEGVYDDPKGGAFRALIYSRLVAHFQFYNQKKLFPIGNTISYSVNIFRSNKEELGFANICNLYLPKTIDHCYDDNGIGPVPGIKDDNDNWNLRGHKSRITWVTLETLKTYAKLYSKPGAPALECRLPAIHSQELQSVLGKLAMQEHHLSDLQDEYFSTQHWNEVNAQNDGTIKRQTQFPESLEQLVISGPHFTIGNPYYQTPREVCDTHRAYDGLDLTALTDEYFPRTNYISACGSAEYHRLTPRVSWVDPDEKEAKSVLKYYRLILRAMLDQPGERTLKAAVYPPGVAHINGARSYSYKKYQHLIFHSTFVFSLISDFLCKTTGKSNLHNMLDDFPWPNLLNFRDEVYVRILRLSCISRYYSDLWEENFESTYKDDFWTSPSEILNKRCFANLSSTWNKDVALRTDFERRQAMLEIDVLVSMALLISLEELHTIYRVQFPVMFQYERETYYDLNGRIIFSPNKGLVGVGLKRKANSNTEVLNIEYPDGQKEDTQLGWEDIAPKSDGSPTLPEGTKIHRKIMDDTLPGGSREKMITYAAPFYLPNREEDYRIAWEVFSKRFSKEESKGSAV
jgi:hypothetical protein